MIWAQQEGLEHPALILRDGHVKVKQTQRHCPSISSKDCHHDSTWPACVMSTCCNALWVIQLYCFYWPVVRTSPLVQAKNLEVYRSVASKWLVTFAFVNIPVLHKPRLQRPKKIRYYSTLQEWDKQRKQTNLCIWRACEDRNIQNKLTWLPWNSLLRFPSSRPFLESSRPSMLCLLGSTYAGNMFTCIGIYAQMSPPRKPCPVLCALEYLLHAAHQLFFHCL